MSAPSGKIVADWTEFGHHFQIEELEKPVLKGAGMRTHRLWDNGAPALGGQWAYGLEQARSWANYTTRCSYSSRISFLEMRVHVLESEIYGKREEAR